jgi:cation:H+ antiporter
MINFQELSLLTNSGIFLIAAVVIGFVGWRLSALADTLADRTGMGEAMAGAVLLGATTSLSGIITSVSTAWQGYPDLAISNAIGGIAAQTAFLAIADITYRQANLEHTAASMSNLLQGTLLIILLTLPLLAVATPPVSIFHIHPATVLMFGIYIYGLHIVSNARKQPMWVPEDTVDTQIDMADEETSSASLTSLWLRFALTGSIVGVAGWFVAQSGIAIAQQSGLSQIAVGGVLTSVATSLPELVTSIAAVRQQAYTLAVAGIIGGNAFDTLFIAVSDIAYRDGSIYHAINQQQIFFIALTILLTSILLMGLLRRQRSGIANIGFESFSVLLFYIGAIVFLVISGGNG